MEKQEWCREDDINLTMDNSVETKIFKKEKEKKKGNKSTQLT